MDERDRRIISILQRNGRTTLSEIAKQLGISTMGVKKRVDKLEKEVMEVRPLLNAEKLEISTAIIAMEVESSGALQKLLNRFEKCPRILKFFVTTGGYNLFAIIWAEDIHSLESITLEECSLRAQPGIRRYEIYPVQQIYYDPLIEIKISADKLESAPCGVDCGSCGRYKDGKCLACPATVFYRGKL